MVDIINNEFVKISDQGIIMSLIIAYMGKKGCVMAADKRKVAYLAYYIC